MTVKNRQKISFYNKKYLVELSIQLLNGWIINGFGVTFQTLTVKLKPD